MLTYAGVCWRMLAYPRQLYGANRLRADEADDTDASIMLAYEDAYALLAVLAASTTKTLREQMLYPQHARSSSCQDRSTHMRYLLY